MIRINLLPHREEKRKQRRTAFFSLLFLSAVLGGLLVLLIGGVIGNQISAQDERNNFIKAENAKLDSQIKEIATLKQEIEALKARQQAVEDLQADRNQPVYLMDELGRRVPEGIYLSSFKQNGQRIHIVGVAQSNERVSELLRNFSNNSTWFEHPDLIEIRSAVLGQGKDARKIFNFTMTVDMKRPRDQDQAADAGSGAAPAAKKNP